MNRHQRIEQALQAFEPVHLVIENESHMHASGRGAESHFKVTVVSSALVDKRRVARHQAINAALQSEFDAGMHALAIHAYTPEEWQAKGGSVADSPACLGVGQ